MVLAEINEQSLTGPIVLTPNFSWSWKANLYLLYTLMGISLGVGLGFMIHGAWLVLPFSILEMLFLGVCIYLCLLKCDRQEVITISEHEVLIESGRRKPEQSRQFNRSWSQFLISTPKHPWDPKIVCIRSHGKELEIGSFLNQKDKSELVSMLKRVVYGYTA